MRLNELNDGNDESMRASQSFVQKPSTKEVFTNPEIRKAAWVGCTISVFQQLTGINAIIFYSSTIF